MAAGIGVTRLARSSHSLRRTGVVFVPPAGETARTVAVWKPDKGKPALPVVLDIVSEPPPEPT